MTEKPPTVTVTVIDQQFRDDMLKTTSRHTALIESVLREQMDQKLILQAIQAATALSAGEKRGSSKMAHIIATAVSTSISTVAASIAAASGIIHFGGK